jgi:Lon protease-like protein
MATELITIDFRNAFPVFPLQDSVLLPQAVLPLHIFEPRYRKMVNDALDSCGFIAMALVENAAALSDPDLRSPRVRPYVGVGQIREYERLKDGRFLIVLQGLCRARIVREVTTLPYRMMRLVPAETVVQEDSRLTAYRDRIEQLVKRQVEQTGMNGFVDVGLSDLHMSTQVMIDLAIAAVCTDTDQRYSMLSQPDVRQRAEWLIHRMQEIVSGDPGQNRHN